MEVIGLLHEKDGEVRGPMSPVLFAREMADHMEEPMHGLARVLFDDVETHQVYEGKGKTGLTGYDTVLVQTRYANCEVLQMYTEYSNGGIPVAVAHSDELEQGEQAVTVTPLYQTAPMEKKLTKAQILAIFKAAYYGNVFDYSKPHKRCTVNENL
jgi:hypothetical protein